MEISHQKAREVWGQLQSAKHRLRNLKESAEQGIGRTKQLVEGVGGAFVSGFLAGRNNGVMPQMFGFDLDLVIGGIGGAAAIMGYAGKYDEDLLNLAIGFAGSYVYREGMIVGKNHLAAASTTTTTQTAGALPANMYSGAIPANQYAGAVGAGAYR